ncbi:MAG: hypothetical protein V3V99_08610 [candidate division Zixibacteria bacterium]
MATPNKQVIFRGYTKKEGNYWVAICIDLNIVAQGSSPKAAREECSILIGEYLKYIAAKHHDELSNYIPRLAPKEFIEEYHSIIMKKISHPSSKLRSKELMNFNFGESGLQECVI